MAKQKIVLKAPEPNGVVSRSRSSGRQWRDMVESDPSSEDKDVPKERNGEKTPLIANEELYKKICKLIGAGYYPSTVAQYCGLKYETFFMYLERGKNGQNKLYRRFFRDVQKAWARAEINRLRKLKQHEDMDWRVSAWMLERMWPEKYALRTVVRTDVNVQGEVALKIKQEIGERTLLDSDARIAARTLIGQSVIDV